MSSLANRIRASFLNAVSVVKNLKPHKHQSSFNGNNIRKAPSPEEALQWLMQNIGQEGDLKTGGYRVAEDGRLVGQQCLQIHDVEIDYRLRRPAGLPDIKTCLETLNLEWFYKPAQPRFNEPHNARGSVYQIDSGFEYLLENLRARSNVRTHHYSVRPIPPDSKP